jgi:CheY-like chemotaxis protein
MTMTAEPLNEAPALISAPKMLIADDDPAIVRMLSERCAKMGFAVETATNGMQLLIKARRSQPDVMIVDFKMPEIDGISVCSRLLDPGSKPVDVVVITGSADPEAEERCESLGLFYGRKGPNFLTSIETALAEIYPSMMAPHAGREPGPAALDVPTRPRVLVVDDDPAMEVFLASRLGKFGIDTLHAIDALHGYRLARREQPCVIIADFFMPDGDAQYLLHRLRSTPETENIPVIVISGRTLGELTEQTLRRDICGRPGAAQVFKKSHDTAELFSALQKYCGFDNYEVA